MVIFLDALWTHLGASSQLASWAHSPHKFFPSNGKVGNLPSFFLTVRPPQRKKQSEQKTQRKAPEFKLRGRQRARGVGTRRGRRGAHSNPEDGSHVTVRRRGGRGLRSLARAREVAARRRHCHPSLRREAEGFCDRRTAATVDGEGLLPDDRARVPRAL